MIDRYKLYIFSLFLKYLNKGSLSEPGINDTKDFKQLDDAMNAVGLSMTDKSNIYRIAAAVLHLGNITFQESTKDKKGEMLNIYCDQKRK